MCGKRWELTVDSFSTMGGAELGEDTSDTSAGSDEAAL